MCKRCCEEIVEEKNSIVKPDAVVEAGAAIAGDADGEGAVDAAEMKSCAFHDARAEKQSAKSALRKDKKNRKGAARAEQRSRTGLTQKVDIAATAT